ncbi:hypothetical protein J2X02_003198 [Pseudoxanthomonas japonensis]|uniref:hypothetical protein n=1 Tax=Pseudoxanthomonas japonensis TaxID=69284 RepID=UPI002854A1F7|nr:hypothetical protein [Pseudoxanthomonas japonensis]MDR7070333.1 hypothetical protein [Pseudoxanthomonas japonensis]
MSRSSTSGWRILLACALVSVGTSTWGSDPVHKCRGRDGQSHYQATPCAATQRTEWVRDFPVDPPAPSTAQRMTAVSAATSRTGRVRTHGRKTARRRQTPPQGAVISMYRDAAGCERAKKARELAYARLGLKRDFATSRKLDDRVNEACR